MLVPGTMRLCNNAALAAPFGRCSDRAACSRALRQLPQQAARTAPATPPAPPRSRRTATPCARPTPNASAPSHGAAAKAGRRLRAAHRRGRSGAQRHGARRQRSSSQDLKKDDFEVFEDGVKQNIISFQHTDLPVSIGLVVDNSGSMSRKRPSVNKSALDLIQASNPQDEAFVVNFSDEAFIDQDFTSDVNKLRDGLSHIDSRGGTALYDAVVASADKLVADAKRPKQVLILITDGEDNASSLTWSRRFTACSSFPGRSSIRLDCSLATR